MNTQIQISLAADQAHLRSSEASPRTRRAFSLIEIIGVLAVLAIGALAVLSLTTKSVDVNFSKQESAILQSFSGALQTSVLRNRHIPDTSDWYQVIAKEMGVSSNTVRFNLRNPTSPRVFLVDPNFTITGGLPYTQPSTGTAQPLSNRVMIVSSISPSAALPAAGIATSNFDTLWNTADGALPANGTFAGWQGTGDDLKIQRVNLGPLFLNLTLANYVTTNQGQYSIDGAASLTVPNTGNGTNSYYLQTTLLELLTDAGSGGKTNARIILANTASYYYVAGTWRNVPYVPATLPGGINQTNADAASLAQMISLSAAMFSSSPYNKNAQGGWTPPLVVNAMSNFMYNYAPYANWVVNSNGGVWATSGPYYAAASSAQATLGAGLTALYNNPVENNCTNAP